MNPQMKFVSVKEAGQQIRFHPNTIRKLIATGKLVATKVGNKFRITEQSLIEYLESNRPALKS